MEPYQNPEDQSAWALLRLVNSVYDGMRNALKPLSGSAPSVRVSPTTVETTDGKQPSKSRQKKFMRHFPQVGPEERVLNSSSNNAMAGTSKIQGIQDKVDISSTMNSYAQIIKSSSPQLADNTTSVSTLASTMDCDVALTTPDAPIYSPITPIDKHTFICGGEKKAEDKNIVTTSNKTPSPVSITEYNMIPETPDSVVYSPNIFIDKNVIVSDSSRNSSPARSLLLSSPETVKVFESLSKCKAFDFGDLSDDSARDPDFITDEESSDSSFHESDCFSNNVTVIADVHPEKSTSSKYPQAAQTLQLRNDYIPIRDDNIALFSQSVTEASCSFRPELEVSERSHRKRRASENDVSQTHKPKKVRRSVSLSGLILPNECTRNKPILPKKRSRSKPSKWKRCVQREKRIKGEAYKTLGGKEVAARPMKEPRCLMKQKHKCNEYVPESLRKGIYESFRSLDTLEEQRRFIVQHVKRDKKSRTTTQGASRRESTNIYHLTVGGNIQARVCREFFLDTLNITEGMVRGALIKISSEGVLECDNRGRKSPPNKLSAVRLNDLKGHIFFFPTMESHYCRSSTEYKFLDASLNIQTMHTLYKQQCLEKGTVPACLETYRKIFRSYKLKFHVPKKDLCKKCTAHKNGESTSNMESHSKHLKRRDDAYLRRDADKQAAKNDIQILAFNFDLEAVLQTPKGASGPFFYVRKLAVYNLTFYKFGDQDVDCYTWDETEGKRGSVEIATCVYKYILDKDGVTHIRMMSDNCGGQQKNYNFCCMLLHLASTHQTIDLIDHVFYESGHSHMECDSVHSKIEQKSKNVPIYTPDGWTQIMRSARRNPRPFNVNVLAHDEFLNFNSNEVKFVEDTKRSRKKKNKNSNAENNESQTEKLKVNFNDAVWIQYRKENPKSIFIKSDYNDTEFTELKLKAKRGTSTEIIPVPVYTKRLPISKAKKRDLLNLCKDNQIPRYYHAYYESLPDSEKVIDRLPEPDADEY